MIEVNYILMDRHDYVHFESLIMCTGTSGGLVHHRLVLKQVKFIVNRLNLVQIVNNVLKLAFLL